MVGLGCGPLFTGIVSDYLLPILGTESLCWAMGTIHDSQCAGGGVFDTGSEDYKGGTAQVMLLKSRASKILSRKRKLSFEMISQIHSG